MAKKLQVIIDGKEYVSQETKKASQGISDMAKTTDVKSKAMVAAANAVKIAFAAVATAVTGLAVLTGKALKEAADFETASVSFKVLIGDAEKAKKTLNDLRTLGAKTPLQFEDITKGAQNLMAFGSAADDVADQIKMLGDLAMGQSDKLESVVRAYGKIHAKGKASMEELNMVTEAGVPVLQALADMYDTTTTKVLEMVSAGKIGFADIDQAFKNMTSSGGQFYGMMDEQGKTLNGMVSTLKDNLTLLLTKLGEAVLPTATKLLGDALTKLDEFIASDQFDLLLQKVAVFAAQTYAVFSHIGSLIAALYADIKYYLNMLFSPDVGNLVIKYAEAIMNNLINYWNAPLALSDKMWEAIGLPPTAKIPSVSFTKPSEVSNFESALDSLSLDLQSVADAIVSSWPKKGTGGGATGSAGSYIDLGLEQNAARNAAAPYAGPLGISLPFGMSEGITIAPESIAELAAATMTTVDANNFPNRSAYNVSKTIGTQFKNMWANSGLYDMFTQTLPEVFGGVVNQIVPFITSLSSVNQILNPLQTIMASMFETLAPVIDTVLAPVVGALKLVGQLLGGMLAPVIQLLTPAIEFLAEIFIWLYNKVFLPAGNGLITVFNLVYNGIVAVLNGIAIAVNAVLGWAGVNMRTYEYKALNQGHMAEIDIGTLYETGTNGNAGTSYTGGGTGSNTSVQSVNITIYQTFQGNVVGAGGMEAVGEYVVDALRAYSGVGGAVQVVLA